MYLDLKAFFFKCPNCGCHFAKTKLTVDKLFKNVRVSGCADFLFVYLTVLWGKLCERERQIKKDEKETG